MKNFNPMFEKRGIQSKPHRVPLGALKGPDTSWDSSIPKVETQPEIGNTSKLGIVLAKKNQRIRIVTVLLISVILALTGFSLFVVGSYFIDEATEINEDSDPKNESSADDTEGPENATSAPSAHPIEITSDQTAFIEATCEFVSRLRASCLNENEFFLCQFGEPVGEETDVVTSCTGEERCRCTPGTLIRDLTPCSVGSEFNCF